MRWVGLVRNVMLGREGLHRDTLVSLVEAAGGSDARRHVTTGNLTFSATRADAGGIGRGVEAGIESILGRHEPVILREMEWLSRVVAEDPFASFHDADVELEVGFVPLETQPLDPGRLPGATPTVLARVGEREVFTARPREGRRRPHVVPLLRGVTGARATARGWSTLQRIVMHGS